MEFIYRNKLTGERVSIGHIDSRYWSNEWESVEKSIYFDRKKMALELIDQMLELEKFIDADYVKLLSEKKIYRFGESVISHGLKRLKELIYETNEEPQK